MMRMIFFAVAMAVAGSAYGSECYSGSATAVSVDGWSVDVVSENTHRIHLTLTSHLPKPTRMMNVGVGFGDVLGNHIGAFKFEPDFAITPSQTVEYSREVGDLVMPRLPIVAKSDVVPYFCVLAVIYADGTKQDFPTSP